MKRDEFLSTAGELISGQRHADYGSAADNFARIAEGWQIIIDNSKDANGQIHLTGMHVALMMDWLKTARLLNKIDDKDGWLDKIGYSALGGEIATQNEEV